VQVIAVIGLIIGVIVVWRSLTLSVIVNDQVARQAHQPILEITLLGIILIQRTVNPYKNLLGQVFGGVGPRSESVGEVIDTPGIVLDNLLPRRAIARPTPANQLSSFAYCQSFYSPHVIFSGYLYFEIQQGG